MVKEKKIEEEISTGDVATIPALLPKPDMLYRNSACFTINKKEFRELAKNKKVPDRALRYREKVAKNEENVYLRYGKHLTFNLSNFMSVK